MTLRTPRTQALAYRIWAYAKPREWNVTIEEVADELRESPHSVRAVIQHRGWLDRIRRASPADSEYNGSTGTLRRFTHADSWIGQLHDWS
jgi:hypothetical protein